MRRHRQDRLVVSGVVVRTESARPPDKCVQRRSVSGGAVRPPDALRRRTHLSGRLSSHRPPDTTRRNEQIGVDEERTPTEKNNGRRRHRQRHVLSCPADVQNIAQQRRSAPAKTAADLRG